MPLSRKTTIILNLLLVSVILFFGLLSLLDRTNVARLSHSKYAGGVAAVYGMLWGDETFFAWNSGLRYAAFPLCAGFLTTISLGTFVESVILKRDVCGCGWVSVPESFESQQEERYQALGDACMVVFTVASAGLCGWTLKFVSTGGIEKMARNGAKWYKKWSRNGLVMLVVLVMLSSKILAISTPQMVRLCRNHVLRPMVEAASEWF